MIGADDELARWQEWARQVAPLTDGLGRRPWRARLVELFAWSARGGVPTHPEGTAVSGTVETAPRCDDGPSSAGADRPSSVVQRGADGPVLVMCPS